MMNYLILEELSTGELMLKVERHIKNGYTPLGGMTIQSQVTKKDEYYERTRHTFHQVVVKNELLHVREKP